MHQKTTYKHTMCFMNGPIYRVHYSLGQIRRGVRAPFKNAESEHSALRNGRHLEAENNKQREGRAERAAGALKEAVHALCGRPSQFMSLYHKTQHRSIKFFVAKNHTAEISGNGCSSTKERSEKTKQKILFFKINVNPTTAL